MDNIERCRRLLPVEDPFYVAPLVLKKAGEEGDKKKKEKEDPPLVALAQSLKNTPLGLLTRCSASRTKVSVMVRYINCIRGTVVGFVDGFDKHCNIVLSHATECYHPRTVNDGLMTQEEVERNRRKARYKTRKFKQLIIRGDNVVMVREYNSGSSR